MVRYVPLPALSLPQGLADYTAFEKLNSVSLDVAVRDWHKEPKSGESWSAFLSALRNGDPDACEILLRRGRALGYLLLMLRYGRPGPDSPRPEWQDAHWDHWNSIREIWLGGGQTAGIMGNLLVEGAVPVLERFAPDVSLDLSPYGSVAVMVGMARFAPLPAGAMLVADFGHTTVKTAIARFRDGLLMSLKAVEKQEAPCLDELGPQMRFEWMLDLLEGRWRQGQEAGLPMSEVIGVSLACYLRDGHPLTLNRGCYDGLGELAPNLRDHFSELLSQRLTRSIQVSLQHDGRAAAATISGRRNVAFLTLGTSLGNGFPPEREQLRPMRNPIDIASAD